MITSFSNSGLAPKNGRPLNRRSPVERHRRCSHVRRDSRTKLMRLAPPANCFDSVLRTELLEDLTLELVDPPKSYAHSIRDLFVGEPLFQILHEFILPLGQRWATPPLTAPCSASVENAGLGVE